MPGFARTPSRREMTESTDPERRLDSELLVRIGGGDEAAFAQFYDRFAPAIYSLIRRILGDENAADDALHSVFAQVWRDARGFDPARSSAFTWAVMVAREKAIEQLRMRNPRNGVGSLANGERVVRSGQRTQAAESQSMHEEVAIVRAALVEIPEEQKQALELAFFAGQTNEQIAERLAAPLGTVKERVRSGLLRLRDLLEEVA
jgi:RNA polymerase sigma-70 factor (ECF subfamily)